MYQVPSAASVEGRNCVGGTDHPFGNDWSTQNVAFHCRDITASHQRSCFLKITVKCYYSRALARYLNTGD